MSMIELLKFCVVFIYWNFELLNIWRFEIVCICACGPSMFKNIIIQQLKQQVLTLWIIELLKLLGFAHVDPSVFKRSIIQQLNHSSIETLLVWNCLDLCMWTLHFQKVNNSNQSKFQLFKFWNVVFGIIEIAWICTCGPSIFKIIIIQQLNHSIIEMLNVWNWLDLYPWTLHFQNSIFQKQTNILTLRVFEFVVFAIAWNCTCEPSSFETTRIQTFNTSIIYTLNCCFRLFEIAWICACWHWTLQFQKINNSMIQTPIIETFKPAQQTQTTIQNKRQEVTFTNFKSTSGNAQ